MRIDVFSTVGFPLWRGLGRGQFITQSKIILESFFDSNKYKT